MLCRAKPVTAYFLSKKLLPFGFIVLSGPLNFDSKHGKGAYEII